MHKTLLLLTLSALMAGAQTKVLKSIPANIQWGRYDADGKAVITIKSGETLQVETISGNPNTLERLKAPDDDNQRELKIVYAEVKDRGPGGHLLTGPIGIEGAEQGNVLQIDILEIRPRSPYGYNRFRPTSGLLTDDYPYPRQ